MLSIKDIDNLQKLALENTESNSIRYFLESCYRYYSKTYHTPLHIAQEIVSPADAVRIYFEDNYDGMEPTQLLDIKEKFKDQELPYAIVEPESNALSGPAPEMSDDEWVAKEMAKSKKKNEKKGDEKKAKKIQAEDLMKEADAAMEEFKKGLKKSIK